MIAEIVVDLEAVRGNVARLGELVAPARYAAVVKSNAYGHGLAEVARAVEDLVCGFCVYRGDEATALRAAGVAVPILVLGPVEPRELDALHAAGAAIALWSEGAFRADVARAGTRGQAPFAVHAKIDTGVTRLGLDPWDATGAVAGYLADAALDLRGVFTHLAAAEELESDYTSAQLARFAAALEPLDGLLRARRVQRHAAASAAAMLFPAARLDAVRAGIATYGIWPSSETRGAIAHALDLQPALSWRTQLVSVRSVEAGRSVGYGCAFVAQRASTIGVIPVGYAEGLPRALSNAGIALVRGRRVSIIGRVCMNMAFVDVTDVPGAQPGDRVTLIGRDGAEAIDANEQAERASTIGYELLARLPDGVPRRYVRESADAPSRETAPA
jgi:alanine racemase